MFNNKLSFEWLLLVMIFGGDWASAASPSAAAPEHQFLNTQHVREEVRAAPAVGALPADKVLHFDMLLPLAAPEQLDQFLAEVYDRSSASYRKFLTPAQFTARFGPKQADWDELLAFAKRSGFTVLGGSRDEMDLRLAGPVRSIEAAFHVKMRLYNHPTEARTFFSPDTEPTVDMKAAVWHISGLDNFALPHALVQPRTASATPRTTTGKCPGNSYCGSDMRAAYYGGTALTGSGQSVGLLEFYGYDSADLTTYYGNAGQTNRVPVNGVSTDGTPVSCLYSHGCDDTEQTLDITQALGMAPGLAQLNVYVGSSDTAILSAMSVPAPGSLTGKVDAQLSCSWGWGPADPSVDDPLFKKFAAQGQSFFTAAGDSAAYTPASQAVFPADDANVTVVGGTDLYTSAVGAWQSESAWSDGGGGYFAADNIPIPAWQASAVAAFNTKSAKPGSTTWRNSPDVSAEANFDFYVCADQSGCTANRYGGTSFAAPMWAGYMALVNQQAAQNGAPPVGFLNPTLYAIGNASGGAYAAAFHDVATGGNGFAALAGYDLSTGWGSPNGTGLINALAASVAPGYTLTGSGPVTAPQGGSGGVVLSSAVTGGFNSTIALSAQGLPAGVTVGFSPASITGAGTSTATFKVAANVAAGSYTVTLVGTAASGTPKSVPVVLTVTVPTFSLSASGAVAVNAGGSGSLTVTSAASGGFNSAIALSASGQPPGVTVSFAPGSINGSGASTLSFQVAANTLGGSYPITILGSGGGLTHTASTTLNVTVPSFSLSASTASLSLTQGLSGKITLSSTVSGGFAAPIALSAAGLPGGISVSFSPVSITGTGSSTATVQVAAGVASGTYPLVLSGSSGGLRQSVTVSLTVGAATFTLTSSATSVAALQGATAGVTLTSAVTGVLAAPVALSVSGQPPGVTASLGASSTVPPATVGLTLQVAPTTAAGSYAIVVTGVSGSLTQKATVTLVVTAPVRPTFAFSLGSTTLGLTHGTSTSLALQTTLTGTAVPVIALSVSGLPAGVTASFGAASVSGAAATTVTFSAAPGAQLGTAIVALAATAGSASEVSTLTLTVN